MAQCVSDETPVTVDGRCRRRASFRLRFSGINAAVLADGALPEFGIVDVMLAPNVLLKVWKMCRTMVKKYGKMCGIPFKKAKKCVAIFLYIREAVISLERKAMEDLRRWQASAVRKPLVLRGGAAGRQDMAHEGVRAKLLRGFRLFQF